LAIHETSRSTYVTRRQASDVPRFGSETWQDATANAEIVLSLSLAARVLGQLAGAVELAACSPACADGRELEAGWTERGAAGHHASG
jgi:hypothetical protein